MALYTCLVPLAPDEAPGGGHAEIRHLVRSPQGDLTHAVCHAGAVAPTHHLPELDEMYFVLAGSGEIWRQAAGRSAVTALRPGRWVQMPAGSRFQYRASRHSSLVFLVVVMPGWRPHLFHVVEGGPWTPRAANAPATRSGQETTPGEGLVDGWMSGDLHAGLDSTAPDGSEIRLLGGFERGSLAYCTLRPGSVSTPVRHRTVQEAWFVQEGYGELWRASADGEVRTDLLWPGVGVDLPLGTTFQFRATGLGPLGLVILTMPSWPGPDEAVPAGPGPWSRRT